MKLQAKERTLLKVCFGLTLAACLLAWITGAGRTGVFATAYASLAATCALLAYERRRPSPGKPSTPQVTSAPPHSAPTIEVRPTLTSQLSVSHLWTPVPAPRRRLTRSQAGVGVASLLLITALAPPLRPYSSSLVLGAMTLGSVAAWGRLSERDEQELEVSLPQTLRCPFCRECFGTAEQAAPCEGCQTVYHSECLEEWNECAVLGCQPGARFGAPARVRHAGASS